MKGEFLSISTNMDSIRHVTLLVRLNRRPKQICVFPEDRPADWSYAGGVATICIDRVDIHSVVSVI